MRDLLSSYAHDPDATWMCGGFGALAEFHFDAGEEIAFVQGEEIGAVTARGAFRLELVPELRPVAYETMSKTGKGWGQGLVLCLPQKLARMGVRTVVTELGPDAEAIRAQDRGAILFDLGIGKPQSDICVRSADPNTIELLREACGRSLFAHGNELAAQMPALSPHRVFRSKVARVEVYQPIPPPDGKTPDGPHTHVRPNLVKHRRSPAQPCRFRRAGCRRCGCSRRIHCSMHRALRRRSTKVVTTRSRNCCGASAIPKHFPVRPRRARPRCRRVPLGSDFESLNDNWRFGSTTALDDLHTHCHKTDSGSRKGSKGNADNPRLPPQL